MADRVAQTHGTETTQGQPPTFKHCWVAGRHGRLPGLLLQWRSIEGHWEGRVVHPVLETDGWVVVEEWIDARLLDDASS